MYPSAQWSHCSITCRLPPSPGRGQRRGGGLRPVHPAQGLTRRDPGNPENRQGGRRCLPVVASLSHNTLKPWDQVQLCPVFPSLPEGQSPGPVAISLPLTLSMSSPVRSSLRGSIRIKVAEPTESEKRGPEAAERAREPEHGNRRATSTRSGEWGQACVCPLGGPGHRQSEADADTRRQHPGPWQNCTGTRNTWKF